MSFSASVKGKEKAKVIDLTEESRDSGPEEVDSLSNSEVSSESEDEEEAVTQEYLDSLLEKARRNADLLEGKKRQGRTQEDKEDVLVLEKIDSQPLLPALNPGKLPTSYFNFTSESFPRTENKSQNDNKSSSLSGTLLFLSRDPLVESAESALAKAASVSSSLLPPPVFHYGKVLTKKQKKELKTKNAGSDWFDLPAPSESDLPRLYREVEALRLRNQLDPKRFYRKEEGEGKGVKGLPKHFAIGKIITTDMPFGGASGDNLTRAERKRTLVDELVDDAEMKRYAKKKFEDLQKVRGVRGRNTKNAGKRKPRW